MSPELAQPKRLEQTLLPKGSIKKIVLKNFKKFEVLALSCNPDLNVLVGDNEAGKSSVLLAIDLALSGSKSKVETLGLEYLINKFAIDAFFAKGKKAQDLPALSVELFLTDFPDPDLQGRCNSLHENTFGIRFSCEPSDDYGPEIAQVLGSPGDNFPFEFYTIRFCTFSGQPYGGFRRCLEHLLIDSSQINTEYAHREYTRRLFQACSSVAQRAGLENRYRNSKSTFWKEHLAEINEPLELKFWLRTSSKANLETDLQIVKDGMAIESKGKGQQSLIKTEFALRGRKSKQGIDVLLLEEPENHLSHTNMRALVSDIAISADKQLFISTHNSLICSRLDLRKAILLDRVGNQATFRDLDEETAKFFCKAPDQNVLEFALSTRVMLVEGNAEYILASALYKNCTGSSLEKDRVHVISVGGTSFKRYMSLAKTLKIRTAVIRDNDGNYQRNCVENYEGFLEDNIMVFSDKDDARRTLEICLYGDNGEACNELFSGRKVSPLDYMLGNKAEAALALVEKLGSDIRVPNYFKEAMEWIRG